MKNDDPMNLPINEAYEWIVKNCQKYASTEPYLEVYFSKCNRYYYTIYKRDDNKTIDSLWCRKVTGISPSKEPRHSLSGPASIYPDRGPEYAIDDVHMNFVKWSRHPLVIEYNLCQIMSEVLDEKA